MGSIKNIPFLERPYEKAKYFGEESLSDSELLSIVLNTGTKNKSAIDIAQEFIRINGLRKILDFSIEELSIIEGIGISKAIRLKAIGEISKRIMKPQLDKIKIQSREDIVKLVGNEMQLEKNEVLKLILLNNQNYIIKVITIAVGSETNIIVNLKQILKEAIRNTAPKIILVHNHPSGDSRPSNADITFTEKIKEASKLIDVELLDHIIIGENNFESI